MNTQPDNATGCLGLDTNPNPPACKLYFDTNYSKSYRPWWNLTPSTRYYWRVGVAYNSDFNNVIWSEERSFTTGPAGGTILPAPTLQSPGNNAVISPGDMLFTWTPMSGAVEFLVWIDSETEGTNRGYHTTTPQLDLRYDIGTYKANIPYRWNVLARNNYAWGSSSALWNFQLNSSQSPGLSMSNPQPPFVVLSGQTLSRPGMYPYSLVRP